MADGNPEIKRGRKFDQVLEGAREVFLSSGFEGASVDEIARAAGVSKATLYSYFPDKRQLFIEVTRAECKRQADLAMGQIDLNQPMPDLLAIGARLMIEQYLSDFGQNIYRICVAESDRFPEIGRAFWETGPGLVRRTLVPVLQMGVARGELRIEDFDLAADQMNELCKADLVHRVLFKVTDSVTEAEKARVADGAVQTFLARYGAG